jgi:hypothetical protein
MANSYAHSFLKQACNSLTRYKPLFTNQCVVYNVYVNITFSHHHIIKLKSSCVTETK